GETVVVALLPGGLRRRLGEEEVVEEQGQQRSVDRAPGRPGPAAVVDLGAARAGPVAGGTTVRLAMPPRFSAARTGPEPAPRSRTSNRATSGAPWPPAATSARRRRETTGRPVRSAIQAGRPIWRVPLTRPSPPTQWKTVWPWATTSAASGWRCRAASAAAAKACPTAVSRRQTASIVVGFGGRAARRPAASPSG